MTLQTRLKPLHTLLTVLIVTAMTGAGGGRLRAQDETYKFDIGVGLGMSGYLGDVNESNLYRNPGFAAQAFFRYQLDARWAFRGQVMTAGLRGNSAQFSNVLPDQATYSFTSQIYDIGGRAEFNFFPYGIGETYKRLRRWTPYLSVGLGVTLSGTDTGTYAALSVPLAAGIRFKVKPRLNLAAEFCVAKTLGDKLDSGALDDLYGIKSSFLKNTDWYSYLMITVSYEFGERCATCHYVD